MPAIVKPDLISVIEKEGIALVQKGKNFWTRCPLHWEKTSSFCVDPEKQSFKCYGCGKYGDSIDFVQHYKRLSFKGSLDYLGISNNRQIKPDPLEFKKHEVVKKFRRWIQLYRRAICELLRLANRIDLQVTTPEHLELSGMAEMYLKKFLYEYHLSILNGDDDKAKFKLYKEACYGII